MKCRYISVVFTYPFKVKNVGNAVAKTSNRVVTNFFKKHFFIFASVECLGAAALENAPGRRSMAVFVTRIRDLNMGVLVLILIVSTVLMNKPVKGITFNTPQISSCGHGRV